MREYAAVVLGAVVAFGTAAVPALNAVLGGAVASHVVDEERRGVVVGAGAGALGSGAGGLLLGTLFYAFLSGLGGPVSTAAWVRGWVVVAGVAAATAAAGGACGAAGALLATAVAED